MKNEEPGKRPFKAARDPGLDTRDYDYVSQANTEPKLDYIASYIANLGFPMKIGQCFFFAVSVDFHTE